MFSVGCMPISGSINLLALKRQLLTLSASFIFKRSICLNGWRICERRVNALSREVIHLRQQLPENYDRLREQLAAVRLSHSGILHNLRDRVEALESEVFPVALALLT